MGLDVGKREGNKFRKKRDYGKHIYTERLMGRGMLRYTHHGIYVGDERVIHYSGEEEGSERMGNVEKVNLEEFGKGKSISKYPYKKGESVKEPENVVERAESLIGMGGYNLAIRNCEHFAHWCATGEWRSAQIPFTDIKSSELADAQGIKPLDGWLALRPVPRKEKTEGGLFIPDDHYHPDTRRGVVVSVPDGERTASDPVVGDQVLVESVNEGKKVEVKDKILWILKKKSVIGVIETNH